MAAQAASVPVTAASFAVLAGGALTCTDSSVTGPVGVSSAGIAVTLNAPRCKLQVKTAPDAFADFQRQYTAGLVTCPASNILGSTLPGVTTLGPGTYCTSAALTLGSVPLAGTLNLTGKTGPWNFVIAAALTATNYKVVMLDGGNPCDVRWFVGAAATFNTPTSFQGTILGADVITFTGTSLIGRAWATGAMTMTTSNILGCTAAGTVPGTCTKDNKNKDKDKDKDKDNKGKDAADSSASVKTAAQGTSESSHGEGSDDNSNKGCDSDNSNKDTSTESDKSDKSDKSTKSD